MESSSVSLEDLLSEAVSFAENSQYQSAVNTYLKVLNELPRHPQANFGLGMLAIRNQEYPDALRFLKTALESSPTTANYWVAYIDALHISGDSESANKVLQQGINKGLAGEKVDALIAKLRFNNRASLYRQSLDPVLQLRDNGSYEAAIDWLNGWARDNPADAQATALLAHMHLLKRQIQLAREAIDTALGIDQREAAVCLNHARVQLVSGQPDLAKQSLKQAHTTFPDEPEVCLLQASIEASLGNTDDAMNIVQSVINSQRFLAEAHSIRGLLFVRMGQPDAAIADCKLALTIKPFLSQTSFMLASLLINQRKSSEAVSVLDKALEFDSENAELLASLGECNRNMANLETALSQLHKATTLSPSYAIAWANYGAALQQSGQISAAKQALRKAYNLNPRLAGVINNLALLAMKEGDFHQALTLFDESLKLAPSNTDLMVNKCIVLIRLNLFEDAIKLSLQALDLEQSFNTQQNFCSVLQELPAFQLSDLVYDKLILALQDGWTRPAQLSRLISTHMASHSLVSSTDALLTIQDFSSALSSAPTEMLSSLFDNDLFQTLLSTTPVVNANLEIFLTKLRKLLLHQLASDEVENINCQFVPEAFMSALAQQCFINDYAFTYDEKENGLLAHLIEHCEKPHHLTVLAMYMPLHLTGAREAVITQRVSSELYQQQYALPLFENISRASIRAIGLVRDTVSLQVQSQYEENPYPKWAVAAQVKAAKGIDSYIASLLPSAPYVALNSQTPSILIAGCGTGQQSIQTAKLFPQSRIVAVDLSLASLAYAMRKTDELGIHNIEYLRADILELGELNQTFDVIQSTGVLHHLAEPEKGWDILTSMLAPKGLMKIALYSEYGRSDLKLVHDFIKDSGIGSSASEIREFRGTVLSSENPQFDTLLRKGDFYNLSNCRDLLFHIQEHQFTIPRIKSYLEKNDLRFLGFVLPTQIVHEYSLNFANDSSATDLDNWNQFELDNPQTFSGMYQFWIQNCR